MSPTTENWYIVVCIVLPLISKVQCVATLSPATEEVENDTYDDYYDYTGYDNDSDNKKDQNENNAPKPFSEITTGKDLPYFENSSVYISADPNTDLILDCDVRNFHVNNVIIWYKDQTVYSHGKYTSHGRVEVLKNNSILLKNIQPDDAGIYYCDVLPENLRLKIVLEVNKMLRILCDGRDVIDRTITFRQSESHICECKTKGSDKANIKWSLNGYRFNESLGELKQNSIILNAVQDYHSGAYQCLDDDGSLQPRHGMFHAVVLFPPNVTTYRYHINVEIGGNADIYCDYKENPIAIKTWLKDNQPIEYSEKYMITYTMEKHFNRSTLTVRDVTANDLGEYVCRAENSLGANELKTHLMLEPEKGQLENAIINGKKVILHWLVRSLQPLSEAVLDYKMSGSFTWSSKKVIHTKRHENGIWKVSHEMELIEGKWQTRMRTKNIIGWSEFSDPFIFKIEDIDDERTNDMSNEQLAMAGFGTNNNSCSVVFHPYTESILILALIMQFFV